MCVASAFLASASAAHAADCKPLQILNTMKMEPVQDGNRFLVPITVNDKPLKFMLDTGGSLTQITRDAVRTLGAKEETSHIQMFDLYGNESKTKITAKTFDMNILHGKDVFLQILPMPRLGEGVDGILSTDLFVQYDVDMDFGAQRLNYFSQDHCEGSGLLAREAHRNRALYAKRRPDYFLGQS